MKKKKKPSSKEKYKCCKCGNKTDPPKAFKGRIYKRMAKIVCYDCYRKMMEPPDNFGSF
jgi:NMD protein affecting ribosome stability and mRNA decay